MSMFGEGRRRLSGPVRCQFDRFRSAIMAPRRGETVAEKSMRSAQRSEFYATKAKHAAIIASMKAADSNIWRTHEFCLNSGLLSGGLASSSFSLAKQCQQLAIEDIERPSSGACAASAGTGTSSRGRGEPQPDDLRQVCGESADAMVHYQSQYQWWLLNVFTLEMLLRACLPHIFTTVAIKALCLRGARKKIKDYVAPTFEYLTSLMPAANIPKGKTVGDPASMVKAMHKHHGHRGRDLILPAD